MTRASKAMLLSALLFPGSGLFLLKKYGLGALLTAVSAVALYLLLSAAFAMAQAISDRIVRGDIPLDIAAIVDAVHAAAATGDPQANLASWVLLGCWTIGVLITYRVGTTTEEQG